jgi:chromosome condensin MukBEF complex kleisin-like MukF subunit
VLEVIPGGLDIAELIDLRSKITERANQVLEAHARAAAIDKSEVVRKVLDDWAEAEIHRATLISRLTREKGSGAT